jgi:hypothetical protein
MGGDFYNNLCKDDMIKSWGCWKGGEMGTAAKNVVPFEPVPENYVII